MPLTIGDLIKSEDIPALRAEQAKVLEQLGQQRNLQPDAGALLMQGVLPMAIAAVLGGGKGAQASVKPTEDLIKRESKRAENEATLGLAGETRKASALEGRISSLEDLGWKKEKLESDIIESQKQRDWLEGENAKTRAISLERNAILREKNQLTEGTKEAKEKSKLADDIQKFYYKRANERKLAQRQESIQELRDAIVRGNVADIGLIGSQLVRSSGDVRISDMDVKRHLPNTLQGDISRMKLYLSGKTSEALTPELQRKLLTLIDARGVLLYKHFNDIERATIGYAKSRGWDDPGEVSDMINDFSMYNSEDQPTTPKDYLKIPGTSEEDAGGLVPEVQSDAQRIAELFSKAIAGGATR
jgi:hypothetical protein